MLYFCTTKKKISTVLLVISLSVILAVAAVVRYNAEAAVLDGPKGATRKERAEFLKAAGYSVDGSVKEEQKEVEIPFVFSEIYKEYNSLQQESGFDLYNYSGKKVQLFTYKLSYPKRDDVYAHILVFDGNIIGGDITALDVESGFIIPIKKE